MSEAVTAAAAPRAGLERVMSDDRLSRRAAAGDEHAFAAIFDRYHQRLYRYCLAIVGNPQDGQDALQNTMVKALLALPGEARRIELKPWLYRVAHNESIELLRRRRETRELDAELAAPGSGLAEEAASRERLRRLMLDLDELPERQRGALVMRELGGLKFEEIGSALGTSSAVARQTVYEARLSLRQMDEGRDMTCAEVTKMLSAGDGRVGRRRDLRAHLRTCAGCRRFGEEIDGRRRDLASLAPLPAVAAAGLLQGLFGGGAGGGGGGLAAAVGGGAAKSVGASVALKGAATVAVVAAIGVGAADRAGLIDAGLPGGGGTSATEAGQQPGTDPAAATTDDAGSDPAEGTSESSPGSGAEAVGVGQGAVRSAALDDFQALKGGGAEEARPTAGETGTAPVPTPSSQGETAASAPGNGDEKQLPSASAHGQQTAAAHKNAQHGSAGTKSHPAKPTHPAKPSQPEKSASPVKPVHPDKPTPPAKPSHPPHPPKPAAEQTPPPVPSPAPEAKTKETPAPPPAAGEVPTQAETGKGRN